MSDDNDYDGCWASMFFKVLASIYVQAALVTVLGAILFGFGLMEQPSSPPDPEIASTATAADIMSRAQKGDEAKAAAEYYHRVEQRNEQRLATWEKQVAMMPPRLVPASIAVGLKFGGIALLLVAVIVAGRRIIQEIATWTWQEDDDDEE